MTDHARPHRALGDADSRFADLLGIDVHHKVAGDTGPAVVLLHHFFGSVMTWRHVLDGLAPVARVAAFDRPGFGLTERPPRHRWNGRHPYTRTTAADLTVALMDHLGFERAVLVGSSAGGTIALETVARHRDRVAGLVLLSPAITGDVGPPAQWRPLLGALPARWIAGPIVRRMGSDVTVERVARNWADPSRAGEGDLDAYARPLRVRGWARGLWDVVTAEPPPNLVDLLGRIDVPTIVAAGDDDSVITPAMSRRTAAHIPSARFELLPGGHTPQEEHPEAVVSLVAGFLAELDGGGTGNAPA